MSKRRELLVNIRRKKTDPRNQVNFSSKQFRTGVRTASEAPGIGMPSGGMNKAFFEDVSPEFTS